MVAKLIRDASRSRKREPRRGCEILAARQRQQPLRLVGHVLVEPRRGLHRQPVVHVGTTEFRACSPGFEIKLCQIGRVVQRQQIAAAHVSDGWTAGRVEPVDDGEIVTVGHDVERVKIPMAQPITVGQSGQSRRRVRVA